MPNDKELWEEAKRMERDGVLVENLVDLTRDYHRLRKENLRVKAELKKMREALIQARGALRADAMVDQQGRPFGTTEVALEEIATALGEK